jgi:hypothetical protein
MKILISLVLVMSGFAAFADVGDKYSIAAKTNRASEELMLVEIVGMTALAPNDATPSVLVPVKAQVDISSLAGGGSTMNMFNVFGGVRDNKLTLQIVYDPADVVNTAECLGADFYVLDTTTTVSGGGTLTDKACFSVKAKDIIIK